MNLKRLFAEVGKKSEEEDVLLGDDSSSSKLSGISGLSGLSGLLEWESLKRNIARGRVNIVQNLNLSTWINNNNNKSNGKK